MSKFSRNNTLQSRRLPPSDTFEERKRRNTICFKPDYNPCDLRVQVGYGVWPRFPYSIKENDVILVPALFLNIFSNLNTAYDELMNEMNYDEFCAWHGNNELDGTHWIMNDRSKCKDRSLLFHKVVDRIANYFNMDVHATRFNLYEKGDEWKPYHFDAAGIDPEKAKKQNITIGVSFGAERSISFQHAKTGTTTEFVLQNSMCYGFGRKVNTTWRHGVPPKLNETKGRISIICWGFCNQNET
jgi:hypothetical protein|tara:strand:- start:17738 stop:18463 length:726 start_codon:yes stop_codon:yes gene_type:complete